MTLGVQTHFSSHRLGPRFITTASLILMTILACAIRSDNQPLIYDPLSLSAWGKMLTMDPPLWRVRGGGGGAWCVSLDLGSV